MNERSYLYYVRQGAEGNLCSFCCLPEFTTKITDKPANGLATKCIRSLYSRTNLAALVHFEIRISKYGGKTIISKGIADVNLNEKTNKKK